MRVNPDLTPDVLAAISRAMKQENTALNQISTGKRVSRPSDDPLAASALVQNQARSDRTDQYVQNGKSAQSLLQMADSTLGLVVSSLTRAISLGIEGATGTVSNDNQQQIAQEIEGIRDQVVQLANVSVNGRHVFAGTVIGSDPFTVDSAQPSGVAYGGNSGTNKIEVADGRTIQINLPGDQVFQASGANVMDSLQKLIVALKASDRTAISDATADIRNAMEHVSLNRVTYGNAMSQLQSNDSFLQQEKLQLKSEENDIAGIDMAEAAINLNNARNAHDAALSAAAKVLPLSLLDYLK
ncbi:MAG TPA: flagellar hook-associated protein FlgL [Terriglobales bacterium]|jgi:flagellar hook-associated protein 3 FlgL|nr:flagellar hook-associated protein FlgL [Terriglobales bacterium]